MLMMAGQQVLKLFQPMKMDQSLSVRPVPEICIR